jgi:hypothetical protein
LSPGSNSKIQRYGLETLLLSALAVHGAGTG